jgi:muramoyltetrapeptide carboxypeptidase
MLTPMALRKARHLRPGDLVGLVAPASPPASDKLIQSGAQYFESRGFRIKVGRYVNARRAYLAGTDAQRAQDLNAMFADSEVRAIVTLRGGYGSGRLLPLIDYPLVRRNPKILVGYSDITALQWGLLRGAGLVSFIGPMAAVEFAHPLDPITERHFWQMLTEPGLHTLMPTRGLPPLTMVRPGTAEGTLLAGNLALIASILGTPYLPRCSGALLAAEDINEEPYRLDRLWTQLRNAGVLRSIHGLLLGQFTFKKARGAMDAPITTQQVLDEIWRPRGAPVASGLPFGHSRPMLTLPIGIKARLDSGRGQLRLLEPAVE